MAGEKKLLKLLGQLGKSYSHLVKSFGGFIKNQPIILGEQRTYKKWLKIGFAASFLFSLSFFQERRERGYKEPVCRTFIIPNKSQHYLYRVCTKRFNLRWPKLYRLDIFSLAYLCQSQRYFESLYICVLFHLVWWY